MTDHRLGCALMLASACLVFGVFAVFVGMLR